MNWRKIFRDDLETAEAQTWRFWMAEAVGFGILMFLLMEVAFPLINGEGIDISGLGESFVRWLIGGFIYGVMMKLMMNTFFKRQQE